ncbi:MAG TPA: hypothetical protein VFK23_09025 [Nitrospirota bacterium]|nr:hypothetical protein [Nitrospirota bacterium]
MKLNVMVLVLFIFVAAAASAQAVQTQITVRVKSKDAKFVGTSMGGALITIRNVQTGELLAKGYTSGGTGNTARIMKTPVSRGMTLSDESAAAYATTIDFDEPTLIEVTAYGPFAGLQSANRVSATQWVVPGKHITGGDGFLLELPGFVVNVEAPSAHSTLAGTPKAVTIRANITMMCGCPITPGGIWDASKIEVAALLSRNGQRTGVLPLQYAGTPNQFTGTWTIQEAGTYEAVVYAYDASNGNTGLDRVTFMVGP